MLSRRDIGVFISELGRRRVFRVAVWYAAAAWAVIELTTTVFPIIGIIDEAQKYVLWIVILAAPVTFVLSWYFDITPRGVQRTEPLPAAATARTALGGAPDDRSVAVLPFRSLSGEGDSDYFSDGVTEDIIAALCGLRHLKVISRTSAMHYRGSDKPIPQIATELGVAHVLEGSVRRAGNRVRIVAQLVDARRDHPVWGETYDREVEDIFAIQSDVARSIAEAMRTELSSAEAARLERRPTEQLDAYDLSLRGRHLANLRTERGIREGSECLERAVALDPDFALAWAALAEVAVTQGLYGTAAPVTVMPRAREAAERALAIEPDLAEALTPRAAVRFHYDWDPAGAEADYRAAAEFNPRWPTAHHWYANFLTASARYDEARGALECARELDPVSPAILTTAGLIAYYERDYERAAAALDAAIARHPRFPLSHMFLGLVRVAAGEPGRAVPALEDAVRLSGGSAETRAALATAHALDSRSAEAAAMLRELDSAGYVSPVLHAQIHAALGAGEAAMDSLERAVAARAADLVWVPIRPVADPLRSFPRYAAIMEPVLQGLSSARV